MSDGASHTTSTKRKDQSDDPRIALLQVPTKKLVGPAFCEVFWVSPFRHRIGDVVAELMEEDQTECEFDSRAKPQDP